jgi:hypothetical protein
MSLIMIPQYLSFQLSTLISEFKQESEEIIN